MASLPRARVGRATALFYQRSCWTDKWSPGSGGAAIDAKRKQEGLVSIRETGRAWDHIELAAGKGLRTAALDRIKIEKFGME
ncbi:MAG TPA: hypothetical protein VHP61_03780 [Acidobacteriota bacterium]|nr:hypothetical protein [Acidobacteriota bacterium]